MNLFKPTGSQLSAGSRMGKTNSDRILPKNRSAMSEDPYNLQAAMTTEKTRWERMMRSKEGFDRAENARISLEAKEKRFR